MTWLLAWVFAALAAAPAPTTQVDARLDVDRRLVTGTVALSVVNVTADPLDVVYLWLEANRFARRPAALNEVNFYWVYPDRFDPGGARVTAVKGGRARVVPHAVAGRGTLVEIRLARPVAPGERARLTVAFETRMPERYGAFGCVDGGCVMAGGFYPMLATLDEAGWDLAAPPAWGAVGVRVIGVRDSGVGVFGVGGSGSGSGSAPYLTVIAGHSRHVSVREHGGVSISYLAKDPPPPADDAKGQTLPYTAENHAEHALDVAAGAVDLLAEIGAPMPAGTRISMAEAPLRLELAQAHPGVVLVSDRIFHLFPFHRFRKFHERELVRAVFAEYLGRRGAAWPARDRDMTAEAAAGYLLDLYTLRAYRKSEFARDLLSPVSFVPAVDELLYAPQVAFADAYFGTIADTDELRDDPRRFMHERPRGHLVYEKLRDHLTAREFGATMRGVIVDGLALRAAAEKASGEELGWFFRQWSGPYPAVNYRLGRRSREAAGGGWRHTIEVIKETPPGGAAPIEPVEVRAIDGAGRRHDLRWDGRGSRGAVALASSAASLRSVEIDPRRRLVESGASASSDDPRFDNRSPARLKFLYNGFGALLNFSNLSFGLLWDFSFRRVHDTRNDLRVTVFASEAVTVGGSIGYSRHFGRNVTPLRRAASIGTTLTVSRLNGDFGDAPSDGMRVSFGVGWGTDDRLFLFEPMRARGASLGARYSVTSFDTASADVRQTAALFGDVTRIVTPVEGHTLVANLEGGVVGGDIVVRTQLLAAGGPGGLRGYFPDELFGRARVTAHLEWRGTLRHDLDWNLGHFWFLRGVGAAAFADAGALSSCDAYGDLFAERNLYADVGMGLRFFYDIFGVQQGMMALDFAVPLALRPRACLSDEATLRLARPPFMLYLTFVPPF